MAIKPTIYKFNIDLTDLNRNYYDSVHLTVAQHPSETHERMLARVLAYCIEAQEALELTKGLADLDEPDIWIKTLDEQISLWLEIGEPSFERIKKATRLAQSVTIYCFNSKSLVWWQQTGQQLSRLPISVIQINWESLKQFTTLLQRTSNMSVTITGESAFIAAETGECEVFWTPLKSV